VVSLRITAWDEEGSWSTFSAHHPRDLERRLVRLTGHGRGEVKRLVRRLKCRECFTLPLPSAADRFAAQTLRSLLESVGAIVEVNDAEPVVARDPRRQ
jgi:hypothetical protein